MGRLMRLASYGAAAAAGGTAVLVWQEWRKPVGERFSRARRFANETADPLVLQLGLAGGHASRLACIEHVGRRSGTIHRTPVYPRLTENDVIIALPLGEASQWAQNITAAGRCRMQYRDTLYELDEPTIVTPGALGGLPAPVLRRAERLGLRYLRLRRVSEVPGTFATREAETVVTEGDVPAEPPIERSFELPATPRIVAPTREETVGLPPRSVAAIHHGTPGRPGTPPEASEEPQPETAEPEHATI